MRSRGLYGIGVDRNVYLDTSMIVIGTAEQGRERRRHLRLETGFEYFKGEWLETDQKPDLSPTAFLVEQPAHSVLPTHFHTQNEFQVVTAGSGMFGRHPVNAISVHYAGAYTGYGPIVAGPEGLAYFTIRSVFEAGAHLVPQHKDQMRPGPKLQRYGSPITPAALRNLRALPEVQVVDVLPPEQGVLAQVVRLPPGADYRLEHDAVSSGQFLMVISGWVTCLDKSLSPLELVFASPDEPSAGVRAGQDGAEILILQVPNRATEYQ